jgi:DNA-binding transcriptional ArsR family regulator
VDAALKAIAEPHRREILRLVWDAERTAGDIASQFAVSRPAVSQHLRVLKEAGLVDERRDGTRRWYKARPDGLVDLREWIEAFWDEGLARLKVLAEDDERRQRRRR